MVIENLFLLFEIILYEHVGTQGTLARDHISIVLFVAEMSKLINFYVIISSVLDCTCCFH